MNNHHTITLHVQNCPRCESAHERVDFRALKIPFAPPEAAPIRWSHWGTCPETGDPILCALRDGNQPASRADRPAEVAW